jgi:hypothetical protein
MKKGSVSYGILIHGILPLPLLKIEPPWYFDPLISNQEIDRGVKITWIGGSIYHWEGGQKYHG